jgi:hypothetical protein
MKVCRGGEEEKEKEKEKEEKAAGSLRLCNPFRVRPRGNHEAHTSKESMRNLSSSTIRVKNTQI